MIELLLAASCATIPLLFGRARTRWLTGPSGRRWLFLAAVVSFVVIGALVARGTGFPRWADLFFVVPVQWLAVVVLNKAFVTTLGYEPRDVYLRGGLERSLPDRIYAFVGFASLILLWLGIALVLRATRS